MGAFGRRQVEQEVAAQVPLAGAVRCNLTSKKRGRD